jgi:hypothetical protein
VGGEATLGLLGRPNATKAGMNGGTTFIPDGASDLFCLCTVCHVLLKGLPFFTGFAGKLEPVMNIKPSYSKAGGIS